MVAKPYKSIVMVTDSIRVQQLQAILILLSN